jgi:hypothetical protein
MRSQPGRSIARCVRILAPLALLAGLLPPFLPGVTTVRARPLPGSTFQSPLPPPALETTFESPLPFPPLPGSDEKTASSSTGLLALAYSVTPARALPGDVVTCTLTAASAAESTLQEAALVTRLPAGVQVLEAEGADHNLEEGELRWSLGRVGPGRVVTLTVRVRVPPDAGQSLLQTRAVLTASATPSSLTADGPVDVEVSAEAVATLRVGQVVTATLTPAGGRLASPDRQVRVVAPDGVTTLADGWVELDAPPGAVSEPTPVTLTVFPEQALGPREMGMALRFSLEPDLTFATPVTLSVGLQGLVPFGHLRAGWWPYLVTLSDPGRFEWEDVPLRSVDWEAGVITTQLEHFSEYGSGVISENGWQLLFNDAQVEHFRGALSYRIPLQVPAGRGGLQPDVVLDYNSDRIDGILAEIQSDWAGLGWSLDAPQIVRSVEWCTWPGEICTDTSHPKLTLVIDGAGYRLVPAEGDDPVNPNEVTPTWGMGRYYADREPSLYVEKQGTGESGVETYWIVRTPDGVEYRFGFTEDARQVLTHVEGLGSADPGPARQRGGL